jgi:hypothetical protein
MSGILTMKQTTSLIAWRGAGRSMDPQDLLESCWSFLWWWKIKQHKTWECDAFNSNGYWPTITANSKTGRWLWIDLYNGFHVWIPSFHLPLSWNKMMMAFFQTSSLTFCHGLWNDVKPKLRITRMSLSPLACLIASHEGIWRQRCI